MFVYDPVIISLTFSSVLYIYVINKVIESKTNKKTTFQFLFLLNRDF